DGVMGISVWLPNAPYKDELFGSAADYAAAFNKAYGSDPDYTAAGCSAAGIVLMKALQQVGATPGLDADAKGKLNEAIAKTDITAFYGPIKFEASGDHFHDNLAPKPFLVQIQDGKVVAIAPAEAAQAKSVYPMKAWKDR